MHCVSLFAFLPKLKTFQLPASLKKDASSDGWVVGGVASSFHRDLDGEAIAPQAIADAIPEFMAQRGADGIIGGPIRLHHDFWTRFLQQAIEALRLPVDEQMNLVAAIALPLGRVTKIWVDNQGTTHWKGILSAANPIARIVWNMLREKMIHLGVSLGGKIFDTKSGGRDRLGRPCTLITAVRLDELSVTDNPALRLTQGEDTGAYISALAKSVKTSLAINANRTMKTKLKPKKPDVTAFLRKAIGGAGDIGSMGMNRDLSEPKSVSPKGKQNIQMDGNPVTTGMGSKGVKLNKPAGKPGNEPKTDVGSMTVEGFCRALDKCGASEKEMKDPKAMALKKAMLTDPEMISAMSEGAYGLTQVADYPPDMLVNFVRFLQKLAQFATDLPGMSDWASEGTAAAMSGDLYKALGDFREAMPKELMAKPIRPEGSPKIGTQEIVFPQQYGLVR